MRACREDKWKVADRATAMVCFKSSGDVALSAFLCCTKSSWICCMAIKIKSI